MCQSLWCFRGLKSLGRWNSLPGRGLRSLGRWDSLPAKFTMGVGDQSSDARAL